MANHPNRSRAANLAKNPTPGEIYQARNDARLTQKQAGALVYVSERAWRNWESGASILSHRRMHPAIWELFLIKIKQIDI